MSDTEFLQQWKAANSKCNIRFTKHNSHVWSHHESSNCVFFFLMDLMLHLELCVNLNIRLKTSGADCFDTLCTCMCYSFMKHVIYHMFLTWYAIKYNAKKYCSELNPIIIMRVNIDFDYFFKWLPLFERK